MQRVFRAMLVGFALMLARVTCIYAQKAAPITMPDSLRVNIVNVEHKAEGGKLSVKLDWQLFRNSYDKKTKTYTGPVSYRNDSLLYVVRVSKDSLFKDVAKESPPTAELTYTVTDLEWGIKYYITVNIANATLPWGNDTAKALIFQKSPSEKGGFVLTRLLRGFSKFSVMGGLYIIIPMYILAAFGFFITWPLLWWRLRLANIFPPNNPGFLYSVLPFDKEGKSGLGPNGNIYIREVAKWWGEAMRANVLDERNWGSRDAFIKATRQEHEEAQKRLWLDVGLPNVEKAIDIAKNGVPGIPLKKKPIEYPFARVLLAALENHRANQNNWWASQEMDRATMSTAVKEVDALKGWELTVLWTCSSIEPMLGLFGTVIGIRQAFMQIETTVRENPNASLTEIVPKLSRGIHVALITTIVGLAVGIPFGLLHYYYKSKLDWIYGKWEELIIDLLNKA